MEARISLYIRPPYLTDSMQGCGEGGKLKTSTQCFLTVTSEDMLHGGRPIRASQGRDQYQSPPYPHLEKKKKKTFAPTCSVNQLVIKLSFLLWSPTSTHCNWMRTSTQRAVLTGDVLTSTHPTPTVRAPVYKCAHTSEHNVWFSLVWHFKRSTVPPPR